MTETIKSDYLIVGAGAVGLAFADVLLSETEASLTLVDRYPAPGGHWNVAYPFVKLHQPSTYYGVSSKELSRGQIDRVGLNQGLNDLASGSEILAYYDELMRHTFLPSGRVRYFPCSDYEGAGVFRSLLSGETKRVEFDTLVDATHLKTSVPSTHSPNYEVEAGVQFITINDLVKVRQAPERFVIVGAGKTGIDACLWLLEQGVPADSITWVVSRDAWFLDRRNTQSTPAFFDDALGSQAAMMESLAQASDMDDAFDRLEAAGYFLRLDPEVRPTMFHGATISRMEAEALRTIRHVVRQGRVTRIGRDRIEFEHGSLPTSAATIHVDCSASAVGNTAIKPVFDGKVITPQMVRAYQPVFSAAFIAHVQAAYEDEAQKNALCTVVPVPDSDRDFFRFTEVNLMNQYNWGQDKAIRAWLKSNRLDGFSKLVSGIPAEDSHRRGIIQRLRDHAFPAMMNLQKFNKQLAREAEPDPRSA